MGSATPSLESYFNATEQKYGLVELKRRYGEVQLPSIQLVDVKEKHRKKEMNGHFSDTLLKQIQDELSIELNEVKSSVELKYSEIERLNQEITNLKTLVQIESLKAELANLKILSSKRK